MKRDVSGVIRSLIRDGATREEGAASARDIRSELTTLGVPLLLREDRHRIIDLTNVHAFRNLHTFVRLLINEVMEQCGFGTGDVMVRRKIDPNLTPELAALGLDWVMIYARIDAAESLPFYHCHFGNCMQVIFRTLQTQRWGGVLFPDFFGIPRPSAEEAPPALLFPFHLQEKDSQSGQYFLVEYGRSGRFLRITIEDAASSRLQLRHIPHRVVDQYARESYLSDVHLIAEQIHQGILRECMNSRSEYSVIPAHQCDLFAHLRGSGLDNLQSLHFTWPTDDIQMMLLEKQRSPESPSESFSILLKEIQVIEDPLVLSCLARGEVIEMISGRVHVFFDLSRYGASLNVSFNERRSVLSLEDYLVQMPALDRAVQVRKQALNGVRLFLIHHITAEVIGLLRAFQMAGCATLTTFFVKYGGIIPDAYLETLMSLPPESFRFYSLQRLESRENLFGKFAFSRFFSPVTGLEEVDQAVFLGCHNFFSAMRLAAGHLFLKEAMKAREKGERLLLVEDGGYLAPLINRFAQEGRTVGEVFAHFHVTPPAFAEDPLFSAWIGEVFLGGVEHTRNGYDYNSEVMNEFGQLRFPVASIAISQLKRGPEARECAVSILNATENILHRLGVLLSKRNVLILGSSGAIGSYLKRDLVQRLDAGRLFGVDIAASGDAGEKTLEAPTLEALGSRNLAEIDVVIGVIGRSIIKKEHLEHMILRGSRKALYFISGSTKTVEFSDVEAYLQSLRDERNPRIGDTPVTVDFSALRDLQTGILQGYRVNLAVGDDRTRDKTLYLLGELMPINFLYYGIPREIVDEVMAQLFTLSCGVVRRQRSTDKLPAQLMAVDHHIDGDANPLR
ncbi:MAG: hypothetical protein ACYC7J_01545 [Syntrophales bacterium]